MNKIDTKMLIGIMQQIDSGYKEYREYDKTYSYIDKRGKGSKSYLIKRIDLLREELLQLKKSL